MRRQQRLLQARRATKDEVTDTVDGARHAVRSGDWLISAGRTLIDIVTADHLEDRYEIVQTGTLVLSAVQRAAIDAIAGLGSTRSPDELVKAIDRLAHIEIGTVKIDFTPGQLGELKYRAEKRGYTITQELQRVIDRIKDEIFYRS